LATILIPPESPSSVENSRYRFGRFSHMAVARRTVG
jgi:hypothetical protein